MSGVLESFVGELVYTSDAPERLGAVRGRESFRMDLHADGCRVISAHSEIDDPPPVVRDVSLRIDSNGRPADCFVRIAVGGAFVGSGWFNFSDDMAECETQSQRDGRISQRMQLDQPFPAFGNHAVINDGFLVSAFDLSQGPGTQLIKNLLLSSPDHRGATGPMLFPVDLAIRFDGEEVIEVAAGRFNALKFTYTDVPGMLLEHPHYHIWCTNDGHFILLKATVGGYAQNSYELTELKHIRHT